MDYVEGTTQQYHSVRVKICGIRTVEEALLSEKCGANAIGLLVGQRHSSSDFINSDTAIEICKIMPPYISTVLVTHLEATDEIVELAERVPAGVLQLHSDLSASQLRDIRRLLPGRKIVGKVSVVGSSAVDRFREISPEVDAVLLDTYDASTDRVGGTGLVHDWTISAKIRSGTVHPVILAGGLRPENLGDAIRLVRPWAVDVNSGVEDSAGNKDWSRVRRFIEIAKNPVLDNA